MPDGSLKKVYDAVSTKYDLGTYDEFAQKIQDPNSRQKLYNAISNDFDLGDYNTFNSKLGFDSKEVQRGLSQEQLKTNIANFKYQPQVANSDLGVDVGMKPVDTQAIQEQEKKTAKEAAINTTHQYFNNNKTLLKELSKTNKKLLAKDADGKDIEDEYVPAQLEKTSAFQKKLAEINQAFGKGDVALTHYQNGKNIGKPVFTKSEGFLSSLGGSISNSFLATKDAIVSMTKSPSELADYYDEQRKNIPEIPESVPVGVGSMVGGAVGGIIKPAAEFALGELIQPQGGGLIAAAADIIPTTTSKKTKEIYYDRMSALEAKYGKGNVPEEERINAIHQAQNQAPLQALPEEAMQLYLFGKGAGGLANKEAIQSFGKVIKTAGGDIAKMAALGGTAELATQGIRQAQSGNGEFDKNISEAAGNWAMMEAAFKALPVTSKALGATYSKFVNSNAKNVLATADPEVTQKLSEQAVQQGWLTQEQADEVVRDVNDYSRIKETIPANIPENKAALVTGLIQKNEALEAEKKTTNTIFHDDINAEIKNNDQKAKDILNSNNPLKYETDNITGERGAEVGGRPTKEETEATKVIEQPTNEGGIADNEPIKADESSTTKENVGETLQSQQEKDLALQDAGQKSGIEPTKINSEKVQYNGQDAIGSRSRSKPEQDAARAEAKTKIKNPSTNASLKTANEYNKSVGLPEVTSHKFKPSDKAVQYKIAETYQKLQDVNSPNYKETQAEADVYNEYKNKYPEVIEGNGIKNYKDLVKKSYQQLIKEVEKQFEALPVKVSFHEGDKNYENSAEMLDDVHNFNHLWVFKGGDDHTELGTPTKDANGLTANDKFRAVHDYFGHSVEGYQFGKDGEENAWIEHSKMFSPLAQWALSSETRGQNSFVNYSGVNEVPIAKINLGSALKKEGKKLSNQEMIDEGEKLIQEANNEFKFAEQKAIILPPKDVAYEDYHSTHIKETPEQLKQISSQIKTENNAIQEQTTNESLLRNEGVRGESGLPGVGERNAEPEVITGKEETPISNEKEKVVDDLIHAENSPTILTHRGLQEIATEFGGEDVTPRERETRLQQAKDAEIKIDQWKEDGDYTKNINDVIGRAKEGQINEVEQMVLANHVATLREQLRAIGKDKNKGILSKEFKDKFDELAEVSDAAKIMRSKAGGLLGSKSIGIPDDTLEGYLLQEKNLNKGARLTNNQITTAVNEHAKIESVANEFKQKYEELQDKYSKLLADRELKKTQAATKKNTKKTHEDFVKDRISLIDKLKKQKADQEKYLAEQGIHKQGFGITLTTDMVKTIKDIVKSHVEETAQKLSDVIEKVHDQLKEVFPDLTQRDIADVIAGKYNEKKKTRSEVVERMQNLKTQQQLIDKYDAMLNGEKPKGAKKTAKFNQDIHELRQKIKGLEKEEKEANVFYGESNAAETRIEKLQDELERLKERKPKEKTERQQREISDKEKELKKQIAEERKKISAEEKEANTRYKENVAPEVKQLRALKSRNETELKKVNADINSGNFAPPEKKIPLTQNDELKKNFPKAYKEAIDSRDALIKAKNERALRLAKQMYENKTDKEKTAEVIGKALNVPRTLMTIGDFSAVYRQAAIATAAHPIIASKALRFMFEAAANEKIYSRWLNDVHEHPLWNTAEQSKLPITDPKSLHAREHEEAFYGSQYAEKIPGVGYVVKASERAYNGYLNFIRWEMFKMYAERFQDEGLTINNSEKLYKGLSSYIGSATGRGGMAKSLDAASPLLNTVLFASKLIAARLNMLGLSDIPNLAIHGAKYAVKGATLGRINPNWSLDFGFYTKLPPQIRIEAAKDMVKFVGLGIATLFLAKQMGADVEADPRSSDFGKIKSGNTRWDIWGGFQPYARLISQIVTEQSKSANTGQIYSLDGSRYGGRTIGDQLVSFGRGKLSPIFGIGADILTRRTMEQTTLDRRFDLPFYPQDNPPEGHITLTDEFGKSFMPLLFNDVGDALKDRGVSSLFTVGIPSLFGIGVQTYQPKVSTSKKNTRTGRTNRTPRAKRD